MIFLNSSIRLIQQQNVNYIDIDLKGKQQPQKTL